MTASGKRQARKTEPSLFELQEREVLDNEAPLAARMRPRDFDDFIGQEHLIGPGRILRKAIEADQVPSMILWGPPGTGKTTLALIIAQKTHSHFTPISAVAAGVADLRRAIEEARDRLGQRRRRTILFVDEIHRFNKAQQDVILPHVENGTIVLIGATTENPSFEVNSPLLSRCRVFTLEAHTGEQVESILQRAARDKEHGLGAMSIELEPDAVKALVVLSSGDARVALNALEIAARATAPDASGVRRITVATVEEAMQRRSPRYDRAGDMHYDTISAFIKCVRGSDPNAAVYWLARMIESGEDPMFIARRLVILAAEDIGLADPQALPVAVAAMQAVHFVGLPEGRIPLSEATIYLASAPKSNSAYKAIGKALDDVKNSRNDPVPLHLRNAVTGLMKELGYGKGYKYSHDYDDHFAPMQNLPESVRGHRYYEPSGEGAEREAADRLKKLWSRAKPQDKPKSAE
ncbi:MAG: replication-associated recombination protein A [SAR202 cluster bacterium]|nr:replication-associated recombination protein A [SAR202 cluster bacterium]